MIANEVAEAVSAGARRLAAAGVASPRHDAEALAAHVLGCSRAQLLTIASWGTSLSAYDEVLARRAAREPLQHIVGTAGFRHLDLQVGPGVFVPRPETELVAQAAIDALAPGGVCVDLCSGSGAIALSVATEVPGSVVHAVEADPLAISWARRNDPAGLVHWELADLRVALTSLDGRVDVVVSNPPYVEADAELDAETALYDPAVALWGGGPDGLDLIRLVEQAASRLLRPGGVVVVEHSDRQGESAPAVFTAAGCWAEVTDHRDLTGRDRFLTATRLGG